jgi:hypothetical protein
MGPFVPLRAAALGVLVLAAGAALGTATAQSGDAAVVGVYRPPPAGSALRVAVADGRAYVGAGESGLRIVDVADPARPVELGSYQAPFRPIGEVAPSGRYAYAPGPQGLGVLDVADPTRPVLVGAVPGLPYSSSVPGTTTVAASGAHVYVAGATYGPGFGPGLHVVDVSDPARPAAVGYFADPYARAVAVAGRYAYLVSERELRVLDVAEPARPAQVGSYAGPLGPGSALHDVALMGRYALVTAGVDGLRVVDAADPTRPVEVGAHAVACAWPGVSFGALAVDGTRAYVTYNPGSAARAAAEVGARVLDVSDPARPTEAASYAFCGAGGAPCTSVLSDVAGADDLVYAAGWEESITVLRLRATGPRPPPAPSAFRVLLPTLPQRC